METIVLMAPTNWSLSSLEGQLASHCVLLPSEPDTIVVERNDSRAYISEDPTFASDVLDAGLGSEALKRLYDAIDDAIFFLIDYSDTKLAKHVLEIIADDPNVVVDADFGTVLPGNLFVSRLRNHPAWHWKSDFRARS